MLTPGIRPAPNRPLEDERYTVGGLLGRGGMGEVLEVFDRRMERKVALKRMRGDSDQEARFLAEARVTGRLDHPNIVSVHDIGVDADGCVYYTMKRIEGQSLGRLLGSGDAGSVVERLQLFLKVCEAVGYAHAQGIVHRDLKPSNIMLGVHGEVHVVDWGLARPIGAPGSGSGSVVGESTTSAVGTPAYMPPEQARGEAERLNERTDIYALGAVLHALLTGQSFYSKAQVAFEAARRGDVPPVLPTSADFPKELRAVVVKACRPDPAERFQTVGDLRAEIIRYLEDEPLLTVRYTFLERARQWLRRNRGGVVVGQAVAVTAILLLTVVGTIYVRDVQRARRDTERQLGLTEIAQSEFLLGSQRREEGLLKARSALARLEALGVDTSGVSVSARLYEQLRPGRFLHWGGGEGACHGVALDSDGSRALSSIGDEVTLWGIPEARRLGSWTIPEEADNVLLAFVDDQPIGVWQRGSEWFHVSLPYGETVRSYGPGSQGRILNAAGAMLIRADDSEPTLFDLRSGEPLSLYGGPERALDYSDGVGGVLLATSSRQSQGWQVGERHFATAPGEAIHISPDARFVLRVAQPRSELLDLVEGSTRLLPTFAVESASFSGDSSVVVLRGFNDQIQVLDTRTGEQKVSAQGGQLGATAVSSDGRRMLACGAADELVLYLLDGQEAPVGVAVAEEELTSVRFSPDGVLIAVGGRLDNIALFESGTRRLLARVGPTPEGVRDLAFSPDGSRLAAAGRDGRVTVWDVASGALEAATQLEDRLVCSVDWDALSTLVVVGCEGSLARWTMGAPLAVVARMEGTPWRMRHTGAGTLVMTRRDGPGTRLLVLDSESGAVLRASARRVPAYGVTVSSDGSLIAVSSATGRVRVYDTRTLALQTSIGSTWGPGLGVVFHPTLPILVTSTGYGELELWDVETWDRLSTIPAHDEPIAEIALSPDGRWMASIGDEGRLMVFDLEGPLPWESSDVLVSNLMVAEPLPPERRRLLGRTLAAFGAPGLALSLLGPDLPALERARLATLAGDEAAASAWKGAADDGALAPASLALILSSFER